MSRVLVVLVALGVLVSAAQPTFAIKQISEIFVEQYAGDSASADFKALVKEASCNVCHIAMQNKKMRNPYGVSVADALKAAELKKEVIAKKDAATVSKVKEIMKKLEDKKPKDAGADAKTFGQRMKEGLLPGGDKSGK